MKAEYKPWWKIEMTVRQEFDLDERIKMYRLNAEEGEMIIIMEDGELSFYKKVDPLWTQKQRGK